MSDRPDSIPPEMLALLGRTDDERRSVCFFSEVLRFAERAGMADSQIYNAIGMNRSLWYRMRDNADARTKKSNVLKLAIVLRLSFWEAYYLIALAGYSFLPGVDRTDEIIARCLFEMTYDPASIDEMLVDGGCEALFSEE